MNHWRAACGESSQARFGGGPTEKDQSSWYLAGGLPDSKRAEGCDSPRPLTPAFLTHLVRGSAIRSDGWRVAQPACSASGFAAAGLGGNTSLPASVATSLAHYGTVWYRTNVSQRSADRSSRHSLRQEKRRQALLEAAREVFDQAGYAAGSLDQVIERVGGSRRAIYSLFGGKRELFAAMATDLADRAVGGLASSRIEGQSVETVLLDFGRRVLGLLTEPTSVVLYRAIVAEAPRFPDLVATFFEHGPGRASAQLAQVLDEFARRGTLNLTDSMLAAELFVGMLRGDLHLRVVLGLRPAPDDAEIERFVHAAVGIFLDGCRAPGARISGPSERKGAKSHA